jgi:hypothetical protein
MTSRREAQQHRAAAAAVACGILVLAATVRPAAAIHAPQTRREFVRAVAAGARGTAVERFVVERSLGAIYGILRERSAACLNLQVRRSGFVGDRMEVSSSDYHPTLRRVGAGKAEFTLQVVHRARGVGPAPPPGGLYVMAADIRSIGKRRTEVVLYHRAGGYRKIVGSLRRWTAGENTACPKVR